MLARCGECCNAKDNASRRVAENVARCAGTRYNISFSGFGGSRRIF